MSALIGWLIASGYVAVALVFARSTLRRWQADPKSETSRSVDGVDRAMSAFGALGFGILWPLTLVLYALRSWLWKPADADRVKVEQMQRDRDDWRKRASDAASPEERATAAQIADTLDDLLRRAGKS